MNYDEAMLKKIHILDDIGGASGALRIGELTQKEYDSIMDVLATELEKIDDILKSF